MMTSPPNPVPQTFWKDRLGVAASTLCALHCGLTAALLALVPTIRLGFFAEEWLEWASLGVAVLVGGVALVPGLRSIHHTKRPIALFATGLGVVFASRFLAPEDGPWEVLGTVLGAAFMVAGHVQNIRASKSCAAC